MATITINGNALSIREGETLPELLKAQGYRVEVIAVEYNGQALRKADYPGTALREGDKLEVVSFVGGG